MNHLHLSHIHRQLQSDRRLESTQFFLKRIIINTGNGFIDVATQNELRRMFQYMTLAQNVENGG